MKYLLATVVFAVCLVAGATQATANDPPHNPCQDNNKGRFCPPPPRPGDEITVTDEPAGENCPNGGIKIEVTHHSPPVYEPRDEPILEPPPPPEPEVEVFFVCNGIDGLPGEPGEPGIPGTPGLPGATIIGPAGIPNIDISQDVEVNVNINGGGRGRCHFARTPRLRLPERLADFDNVRVRVDRVGAQALVTGNSIQVRKMRGKRCGPHVVTVRKRGVEPTVRLWTVLSKNRLNRRVLVP